MPRILVLFVALAAGTALCARADVLKRYEHKFLAFQMPEGSQIESFPEPTEDEARNAASFVIHFPPRSRPPSLRIDCARRDSRLLNGVSTHEFIRQFRAAALEGNRVVETRRVTLAFNTIRGEAVAVTARGQRQWLLFAATGSIALGATWADSGTDDLKTGPVHDVLNRLEIKD